MNDQTKLSLYGIGTFLLGLGAGRLYFESIGTGLFTLILGLIIIAYSYPVMAKAMKKMK